MESKFILMASIILVVLMVGAVSAADTISEDVNLLEITQNYIHTTDKVGSFSELEGEINASGDSLEITKDYTFNNETDNPQEYPY